MILQLSFTHSTTHTAPAIATSSCSTLSPKVLTTLKVGNSTSTTQVVHLSSPQSIGSFANFKLQSLLHKPPLVPSPQSHSTITPCLTPPTGTTARVKIVLSVWYPLYTAGDVLSSGCVLSSSAVPLTATSLQPGVHRIGPRVVPPTPVTASQFVTLPNVPLVPKAAQSDG